MTTIISKHIDADSNQEDITESINTLVDDALNNTRQVSQHLVTVNIPSSVEYIDIPRRSNNIPQPSNIEGILLVNIRDADNNNSLPNNEITYRWDDFIANIRITIQDTERTQNYKATFLIMLRDE